MPRTPFLNLEYLYEKLWFFLLGPGWQGIRLAAVIIWFIGFVALPACLIFIIVISRRIGAIRQATREKISLPPSPEPAVNPRWEQIWSSLNSTSEADWKLAIIEADTILEELAAKLWPHLGDNLGERLKKVEPSDFATLQNAWEAHRVRNEIAHNRDYVLTEREAKTALANYKAVFEEFQFL